MHEDGIMENRIDPNSPLAQALRSLERKGMIESFIDARGEVRWRATAMANAVHDGLADWPEDSRSGIDS
jgi:hypothetical protein